jgi:hypothetical protein
MKKKPKKQMPEQFPIESDEHFAFIAGYTSDGAPYGVTWEEMEAAELSAVAPCTGTPPTQGAPVSLNNIVQEMQAISDTITIYFKRSTGEFIMITDEYVYAAESDEPLDDRPEWEQAAIQMTADVLAHANDGDYVSLPSRYDIHEHSIMERFCRTVANQKIANDLSRSLSGKGAFRRFKDTIRIHGIEDGWYRFRDEIFTEIAREWCKENGITWRE